MNQRLLRLKEAGRGVIFQNVLLVRFRLFCIIGAIGLVETFSANADFGPVALGLGNDVLSGSVAASPAAMNELGSDGLLSVTETFADSATTDIPQPIKSEKLGKRIAELQPPTEARIGMQILGGLALLLWVQRLRSYGN